MTREQIVAKREEIPYEERLLTPDEIAALFDISLSTLYRSILSHPNFPVPVKIPGGPKRWVAGEVLHFSKTNRQTTRR